MGDRARFDDQGLTETGLSSSISNLFVSAVILTDKQSACNITSTLTECDSASTRHEKMAVAEWIGNKQKAIQKALLEESLFAENIFPEESVFYVCASQEVFPYLHFLCTIHHAIHTTDHSCVS